MTIRNVTPADRAQYLAFSLAFYAGDATLHTATPDFINRTFDECVKGDSPYARAVMMEENGSSAGYAQLSFTWCNESGGMVALLEELYVAPEFRGLHLGSQLLAWFQEEYRGYSRLRLELCPSNDGARRLYERYGFTRLDYEQMILEPPVN